MIISGRRISEPWRGERATYTPTSVHQWLIPLFIHPIPPALRPGVSSPLKRIFPNR
jgi:hypothetical protein